MKILIMIASVLILSVALCACNSDIPPATQDAQQKNVPHQTAVTDSVNSESNAEKAHFNTIFQVNANGSVSPRMPVSVNGIAMAPGVSFGEEVSFGGLNLATMKDKIFLVERQSNLVVIKGVSK